MLAVAVADQLATVGGHNFNEAQEIGAIVAAQLEHTDKSSEPGCLSFKDLADVLSAQKSVPSLAQLDELIDRTKIGAEERPLDQNRLHHSFRQPRDNPQRRWLR